MNQDYTNLSLDELEAFEKQTFRTIVQAVQQYSKEAKILFDTTKIDNTQKREIIVLAEDITEYALSVAEIYPIDKRFTGFTDYKKVRWIPFYKGLIPQVLLVDAKASTENTRANLQRSQLPMKAEWIVDGIQKTLEAGFSPDLPMEATGGFLRAVTTSIFVHFHYTNAHNNQGKLRSLLDIYLLCIPHASLKEKYNPHHTVGFWIKGKQSDGRNEVPRIRVSFRHLSKMCRWRLQKLTFSYNRSDGYATPIWRDSDSASGDLDIPFMFIPREAGVL